MEKNLPRLALREVHDLRDGRIEDRPRAFDFHAEERLPEVSTSQSPSTLRGTPWTLTPKAKRTPSDWAMSSLLS